MGWLGKTGPEMTPCALSTAGEARIGVRWTVGDVSARGFQALRLSILGARRVFGAGAGYAVCVNSLPVAEARARVGEDVAGLVHWHLSDGRIPDFLRARLSPSLAEGVAWKFAPARLFPDRYEIALDNDCILWERPAALGRWLAEAPDAASCVLAADVLACFGWFAPLCGPEPRNTGLRGLPPGFDLEAALRTVLAGAPDLPIAGEVDEQGMQVAALSQARPALVVSAEEITICSPHPPHVARLGSCGAHFVGVNMRRPRPEHGCDQAMLDRIGAHWDLFRARVEGCLRRAGALPLHPTGAERPQTPLLWHCAK